MIVIHLALATFLAGHVSAQSDSSVNSLVEDGIRHYYTGQYRAAIEYLSRALKQDPSMSSAYGYLGLCAAGLGECENADQYFHKALDRDPSNLDLLGQAAQVLLDCGLRGKSESYFTQILRIAPNHLKAIIGLSQIYSQEAEFDRGITYLQRGLKVDPHNLQLHYMLGSLYLAMKKPELAVSDLLIVLHSSPKHFAALRDLGTAYFLMDSLTGATVLFQQALNIEPANGNLRLSLANCHYKRKHYTEALSLYQTLEKEPFLPNVYLQEGLCYFYLSRFDSAIGKLRLALSLDSTIASAHFNFALSLAAQQKFRDAISEFNNAIKYSKDELVASSYDRIGTAYYEMKRKESALKAYRRAIAEDPQNVRAYYDLGVLYETLYKDKQEAIRCYGKVVELGRRLKGANPLTGMAEKRISYLASIK